jgi:hypothetical protein
MTPAARAVLEAADRRRRGSRPGASTLAPDRPHATPLTDLVPAGAEPARADALARGLADIVSAWAEHFPENIFWDVDLLAQRLWALEDPGAIARRARRIADLARGFGHQTEIRFQYVHDFLYGYDWCRWVARDPEEREHVGPFDADFLAYLERRQAELLELIAQDDAKYPRLENGRPRNPFGFSRHHEDERRLLRTLAQRRDIPVETWRPHGRCSWDRPFARIREQTAEELGLTGRA